MDYKALIAQVYELLKSFLALIGVDFDLDKITGEIDDILGA